MGIWGPLAERFESPKPQRKALALDGGGIRGIITLEILSELERQLAQRPGASPDFRLCDYFDYVGGTSTGAIIAAGIARGMSTAELLNIYTKHGAELFDKAFVLTRLKNLYKSEPIAEMMRARFGANTTLEPQHLRSLLLAVTQNLTTDSPWPKIKPDDVQQLDSVEHVDDLSSVGKAAARQVSLAHLGSFV